MNIIYLSEFDLKAYLKQQRNKIDWKPCCHFRFQVIILSISKLADTSILFNWILNTAVYNDIVYLFRL